MTHTEDHQTDNTTRDPSLRDLLTIRSYLRDRRDDLTITVIEQRVFAMEVHCITAAIAKAEAEAAE
jgi:hypothetical protein